MRLHPSDTQKLSCQIMDGNFAARSGKVSAVDGAHAITTHPSFIPRANSTERRNQEIKQGLRVRLDNAPHIQRDKYLPAVHKDLRCRTNKATGYSPTEAILGYKLPQPEDWDIRDVDLPEAQNHPGRDEKLDHKTKSNHLPDDEIRSQRRRFTTAPTNTQL